MEITVSKSKVEDFKNAAEKIIANGTDEQAIKTSKFKKEISMDPVSWEDITDYGCPCWYIHGYARFCDAEAEEKTHPAVCDNCILCWRIALSKRTKTKQLDLSDKRLSGIKMTTDELCLILKQMGYESGDSYSIMKDKINAAIHPAPKSKSTQVKDYTDTQKKD